MAQLVQIAGSLLILAAFVGERRGRLTTDSTTYLGLNLVGSCVLALLAARADQYGFLLLEVCWAVVSGLSIARALHGSRRRDG